MIKYTPASERSLSLFRTPFEQELDPNNRWVNMAAVVPWDEMAKVFFSSMSADQGRESIDLRIVLGALLVKHVEGISDEDTIQYIQENIYTQYFVGLPSFQTRPVFVPTLFVEIRKRLGKKGAQELNDMVLKQARRLRAIKHRAKPRKKGPKQEGNDEQPGQEQESKAAAEAPAEESKPVVAKEQAEKEVRNKGTLKMDATVAPQHIGYPTDTRLLSEARVYSEELIDKLYQGSSLWKKKPRTYRRNAHDEYLAFAKKRKPGKQDIKRTRGKQLRYLRRNLKHINCMLDKLEQAGHAAHWKFPDWQRLWVIQELYRQQDIMHRDGRKRIDDRIVNIAQPYVRPIIRGKAGSHTEFGAKLNVSETEGFVRMDQVDFDNFNEGILLQEQVEGYKALYGYYPELVLVDQIYLNRENRNYLKDKGIRHAGKPLGRPPEMSRQEKQKRKKEQNKRSEIEGKFGQGKSKYGLDDIQTRREDTSYACIGLILLALNVIKLGGAFLVLIFSRCRRLCKQVAGREANINSIFGVDGSVGQVNLSPAFAMRQNCR
ncbi:MAG: IS5 family transposase [Lewinellaceae bacterium]|nr:IS5 family transposase [Lewinellaceae bacterium]